MALSPKQSLCLAVIESSIRTRGYPPTMREIGDAMGIRSTNGVACHLDRLERKGFIKREIMHSRGITVLRGSAQVAAAIEYAKSDADWIADVVLVCIQHGFAGSAEDLPKWLDERLGARKAVA